MRNIVLKLDTLQNRNFYYVSLNQYCMSTGFNSFIPNKKYVNIHINILIFFIKYPNNRYIPCKIIFKPNKNSLHD